MRPDLGGAGAVLLAPGAGSDRNHPTLVALDEALAPLPVARVDFPYRKEGRKAPDRASKLMAAVRDEIAALPHDEPLVEAVLAEVQRLLGRPIVIADTPRVQS